jgi:hypothetical protein
VRGPLSKRAARSNTTTGARGLVRAALVWHSAMTSQAEHAGRLTPRGSAEGCNHGAARTRQDAPSRIPIAGVLPHPASCPKAKTASVRLPTYRLNSGNAPPSGEHAAGSQLALKAPRHALRQTVPPRCASARRRCTVRSSAMSSDTTHAIQQRASGDAVPRRRMLDAAVDRAAERASTASAPAFARRAARELRVDEVSLAPPNTEAATLRRGGSRCQAPGRIERQRRGAVVVTVPGPFTHASATRCRTRVHPRRRALGAAPPRRWRARWRAGRRM